MVTKSGEKKRKSLLPDVFSYLKKPKYPDKIDEDKPIGEKIWAVVRIWFFQFLLILPLTMLINKFLNEVGHEEETKIVDLALNSFWVFFIMACIYAPLREEGIFRIWLKTTKINISIGASLITTFLVDIVLGFFISLNFLPSLKDQFDDAKWFYFILLELAIFAGLFLIFYYIVFEKKAKVEKVKKITKQNFGKLFYITALVFALAHITNYTNIKGIWFLIPLLVSPQLVGGLSFGYIRAKFGIIWSILAHFVNNLFPVIYFAFLNLLSDEAREVYISGELGGRLENVLTDSDTKVMNFFIIFLLIFFLALIIINIYNFVELIGYYSSKKKRAK